MFTRIETEPQPTPPRRSGDYVDCDQTVYDVLIKVLQFEEFSSFRNLRYKLIFRAKPKLSKGRRVLGAISIFKERDALLHDYQVLIEIDENYWALYPDKREPLLYHELCHLAWDEELDKPCTLGHDFEDFYRVIRRYGDWQKDLEKLNMASLQLQLELDGLDGLIDEDDDDV